MRNSNKAPKFSSMTEYELQNFYSNKKEGRKNVRQELSIYIVWFSAAINLGSRWKRGHPYITSFFISQEICLFHSPARVVGRASGFIESDDRSPLVVSRLNPAAATFAFAKLRRKYHRRSTKDNRSVVGCRVCQLILQKHTQHTE